MRKTFGCMRTAVILALALAGSAAMAEEAALPGKARAGVEATAARLKSDAVCTRCHDESENKPLLAIYQTRHGVTADPRTPACQSCHGPSDKHVAGGKGEKNASRPSPDIVFATRTTVNAPTEALKQQETCLSCHKAGKRLFWDASQHQNHDVPCSACHSVHVRADPVLAKATQPEVCFACHKTQRAQTHRISTHPIDAGLMSCYQLPQPARQHRPEVAGEELGQRDLLHLPRREARPVPLGARAGRRRLHQLPHAARLDQHAVAQDARRPGCARNAIAATTARR